MKIVEVKAVRPPEPEVPDDWRDWLGQIAVSVKTDNGMTGFGVGGGGKAGIHVIETVLNHILIGRDPSPVEDLFDEMYSQTMPFGRKGLAIMAISGVDLALWDLRGKRDGKSIVSLLGGRAGDWIPMYFTNPVDPAEKIKEGYRGVKLLLRGALDESEIVRIVRDTRNVIGSEARLMIDLASNREPEDVVKLAETLRPYDLSWIECPIRPDDIGGYAWATARSCVPIAAGEHEYTSRAFRQIIERKALNILQPDICWCGGLTEVVRIYRMAEEAGIRVCLHRGSEIWGLQALAALDKEPYAESGRPWIHWVDGQPRTQNGKIRLEEKPGFGVAYGEECGMISK